MDYDDNAGKLHIHLKPGPQVLGGYDAMCYVRYATRTRRANPNPIFQRQQRQKDLLLGFKQAVFTHWSRLPEIADAGKAVLGDSLTDDQIRALAGFGRSVGQQKISSESSLRGKTAMGFGSSLRSCPKCWPSTSLIDTGSRVSYRQTP